MIENTLFTLRPSVHPNAAPAWDVSPAVRAGQARGMAASARVGISKWSAVEIMAVDMAIESLAASGSPFTSDDVWERLPGVAVTKGMGGRLGAASRRGLIKNMGYQKSARAGVHGHGQNLTIWRGMNV